LKRLPNFSFTAVKEKFGNRFKLVDAICEIEKRSKDEGFKKRLLDYPVPRLYDVYRSAAKRAGVAVEAAPSLESKLPKGTGEAPKPKAPKAEAKAAPAKASKAPAKKAAAKSQSSAAKKGKR